MSNALIHFAKTDVSRETMDDLESYERLIRKWNPVINLVSKASLDHMEARHFADSLQLLDHIDGEVNLWADFGSGGGFPAIVLAIHAKHTGRVRSFVLVESDQRKAAFLREVVRTLDLPAAVIADRAEGLEPLGADVVSARALGPLTELCGLATRHMKDNGVAIFPKGARFREEIAEAQKTWSFEFQAKVSRTDPEAAVLCLRNIAHA